VSISRFRLGATHQVARLFTHSSNHGACAFDYPNYCADANTEIARNAAPMMTSPGPAGPEPRSVGERHGRPEINSLPGVRRHRKGSPSSGQFARPGAASRNRLPDLRRHRPSKRPYSQSARLSASATASAPMTAKGNDGDKHRGHELGEPDEDHGSSLSCRERN
jgi:hypothetical protein